MTAICPAGGPSGIKAGVQNNIIYSSAAAGLLGLVPGLEFLDALAIIGGAAAYDLTTICPLDPPGFPAFTQAELIAAAGQVIGADLTSFGNKLKQTLDQILWYQFCECTGGGTPAIPATPAAPSGVTVIGNSQPTQPCIVVGPQGDTVTSSSSGLFRLQAGKVASLGGPILNVSATRVTLSTAVHTGPGVGATVQVTHEHTLPTTATDDSRLYTLTSSQTIVDTIPWNPNASVLRMYISGLAGSGSTDVLLTAEQFCNGDVPGGETSPCCPPDPTTQAQLNAILGLVTLIQRQIAPFAYIAGTAHTGISGNGQIAVQGLLGVSVDVTTLPARAGVTSGHPDELWDVGWINVGTADGWGPRQFISSNPFLLRPIAGDVTLIGYSIPADVVVTITELVREP